MGNPWLNKLPLTFIGLKDYLVTVRKQLILLTSEKNQGLNQAKCFGVKSYRKCRLA
jgi:hypothetical protein